MSRTAISSSARGGPSERSPAFQRTLWVLIVLAGVLGLLFARSFDPSQVLFANDAPLGNLKSQESNALSNFFGAWQDLNWLGSERPSSLPDVTYIFYLLAGALLYAKFYVPLALLLFGLSTWFCLSRLGFKQTTCVLGGLAAALNGDALSYACWGLPPISVCMATTLTAVGFLAPQLDHHRWMRLALAGLCVGFGIMEGYDVGAILSLYVAAFVLFQTWQEGGLPGQRLLKGSGRVVLVAIFAAFLAAQALSTLIGTQVKGIVGTQQDSKTKEQRWDEATMWSLPKIETLRVAIPGLFGYRMDTPDGGNYWGAVGQTPGVMQSRHSGSGVYAGVLVLLLAAFGIAQAASKTNNPFTPLERRWIWFWLGAAVVSLLLAYGRHAPFYQIIYSLPYFSTIRNPIKFLHPFHISVLILFGYGVEGLLRTWEQRARSAKGTSLGERVRAWWASRSSFDRKWTIGLIVALAGTVLGLLLYASSRAELVAHLQKVGFPGDLAPQIARFSIMEVAVFLLVLLVSAAVVLLIMSAALPLRRVTWVGALLGLILAADMARANRPWIVYYDYRESYALNPVLDVLRTNPHEHRVAARLAPLSPTYLVTDQARNLFQGMTENWLQHHFQYYNIQSLDIVQMPRMPEIDAAFMKNFTPKDVSEFWRLGRLWQLTTTRYVLGMKGFLDMVNQQVDPTNQSFRVATAFDFTPKPSAGNGGARAEDITAVVRPEGQFAIFEFGAALPRARMFEQWQVITNDTAALQRLAEPDFDPRQTVLVADNIPSAPSTQAAPASTGTVTITHYEPKRIVLQAAATAPSILLLNDKYDPNWKVTVDGTPQPLLRCNYIMRGVQVPTGNHQIEFRFAPPHWTLYITLAALIVGLGLCALVSLGPRPRLDFAPEPAELEPASAEPLGSAATKGSRPKARD